MHKICERTDTKIVTAYKHLHTNFKKKIQAQKKTLVNLSLLGDQYLLKTELMNAVKFPTGSDLQSDNRILESKEVTVDK